MRSNGIQAQRNLDFARWVAAKNRPFVLLVVSRARRVRGGMGRAKVSTLLDVVLYSSGMSVTTLTLPLAGDGIGPEVCARPSSIRAVERKFPHAIHVTEGARFGWAGIDAAGSAVARNAARALQQSDAFCLDRSAAERDPTIPQDRTAERGRC